MSPGLRAVALGYGTLLNPWQAWPVLLYLMIPLLLMPLTRWFPTLGKPEGLIGVTVFLPIVCGMVWRSFADRESMKAVCGNWYWQRIFSFAIVLPATVFLLFVLQIGGGFHPLPSFAWTIAMVPTAMTLGAVLGMHLLAGSHCGTRANWFALALAIGLTVWLKERPAGSYHPSDLALIAAGLLCWLLTWLGTANPRSTPAQKLSSAAQTRDRSGSTVSVPPSGIGIVALIRRELAMKTNLPTILWVAVALGLIGAIMSPPGLIWLLLHLNWLLNGALGGPDSSELAQLRGQLGEPRQPILGFIVLQTAVLCLVPLIAHSFFGAGRVGASGQDPVRLRLAMNRHLAPSRAAAATMLMATMFLQMMFVSLVGVAVYLGATACFAIVIGWPLVHIPLWWWLALPLFVLIAMSSLVLGVMRAAWQRHALHALGWFTYIGIITVLIHPDGHDPEFSIDPIQFLTILLSINAVAALVLVPLAWRTHVAADL